MKFPAGLMRKIVAAAGSGGAMLIAVALLGGHDGVEGRRYTAYQDVGGVWTTCDGITGSDVKRGHRYTDAECDALLVKHLTPVKRIVDRDVKVPIDDYTRAALYSFAYNVGTGAFERSSLLRHLNGGDTARACDDLHQWVYVNGKRNRGLVYRRYIDQTVCMMGAK